MEAIIVGQVAEMEVLENVPSVSAVDGPQRPPMAQRTLQTGSHRNPKNGRGVNYRNNSSRNSSEPRTENQRQGESQRRHQPRFQQSGRGFQQNFDHFRANQPGAQFSNPFSGFEAPLLEADCQYVPIATYNQLYQEKRSLNVKLRLCQKHRNLRPFRGFWAERDPSPGAKT